MSFIDDFFVFPQAVSLTGALQCDIFDGDYKLSFNGSSHIVKLSCIPPNSTTMLLYIEETASFLQIDQWEEAVSQVGVTSQEALRLLRRVCFMQIDYYHAKPFIKVFLPINQVTLQSSTHDFSLYSHFPVNFIHPVDWQYQINADVVSAKVSGEMLELCLTVLPPVLSERDMYLTYGHDTQKLVVGENRFVLPYVKGEHVYLGNKPLYKGRGNLIPVESYL
jgi:hypothetical protein